MMELGKTLTIHWCPICNGWYTEPHLQPTTGVSLRWDHRLGTGIPCHLRNCAHPPSMFPTASSCAATVKRWCTSTGHSEEIPTAQSIAVEGGGTRNARSDCDGLVNRAPTGLRTFAVERQKDESGVSGTGIVLEGVVFSTGVTVVHWLTPPPFGSLNIFASFEQFMAIHVGPHPTNETRIHWSDGVTWEPGDYTLPPSPFQAEASTPTTLTAQEQQP